MNKKGEEIVEAAIILPLTILTILSMIMVAVILFRYEISQSKAHVALAEAASSSKKVFAVKRSSASASGQVRGTAAGQFSKSGSYRMYVISQADAIMIGQLAG